jgi:hypothetical protein
MKRCVIDLPTFRVSKPGYDVDTAALENLLFHESFLFTQPYFFQFVPCPFAGDTSSSNITQTVSVTVPNVTSDPIVLLFMASNDSTNVFPDKRSYGEGNDFQGYNVELWTVDYLVVSSTRIDLTFVKSAKRSPQGAYMMLMRKS